MYSWVVDMGGLLAGRRERRLRFALRIKALYDIRQHLISDSTAYAASNLDTWAAPVSLGLKHPADVLRDSPGRLQLLPSIRLTPAPERPRDSP
jgi:hypothetical protein